MNAAEKYLLLALQNIANLQSNHNGGSSRQGDSSLSDGSSPRALDNGAVHPFTGSSDNSSYKESYNYFLDLIDKSQTNDPFRALNGNITDNQLAASLGWLSYNSNDEDFRHGAQQDLLKWLQTLNQREYEQGLLNEQRDYNKSVLDEQRLYDSPLAQLQRLMGTGLSRGAALEFLNSGGAGSGSPLIGSPISASAPSYAADYNQPGGTTLRNRLGIGLDILNSLINLTNLGFNGFSAIKSGTLQQQQASALQLQNNGAIQSSQFNAMYQSAIDRGLIDKKKINSFDDARKAMLDIPDSAKDIYDYMHNGAYDTFVNTPYALRMAGDDFKANYEAGDSVARSRQMMALAAAYELQPDVIVAGLDKNDAEIQKIFADIANDQEMLALEKEHFEHQNSFIDAQAELSRVEKSQRELENERINIALNREKITADDLDQVAIYDASRLLQIAAKSSDPDVMKDTLMYIADNEKMRRGLMAFNLLRLTNTEKMLNLPNGQALLNWSSFYDDLNLGGMFNSYLTASGPDLLKGKRYAFDNFVASFGIQPRNWFTRGLQTTSGVGVSLFGD